MPVGGNESFPGPAASGEPLLELDDLTVWLDVAGTRRAVLRGVSLAVDPGESVGLVGESGSGKTMTARAACRARLPDIVGLSSGLSRCVRAYELRGQLTAAADG